MKRKLQDLDAQIAALEAVNDSSSEDDSSDSDSSSNADEEAGSVMILKSSISGEYVCQ
jgi:hypothetical protein